MEVIYQIDRRPSGKEEVKTKSVHSCEVKGEAFFDLTIQIESVFIKVFIDISVAFWLKILARKIIPHLSSIWNGKSID
jgi:hypothetical protein